MNVQSRLASDQYKQALAISLTGVYVFLQENLGNFFQGRLLYSQHLHGISALDCPDQGEPGSALALEQVGSLVFCMSAFLCFLQKSTP